MNEDGETHSAFSKLFRTPIVKRFSENTFPNLLLKIIVPTVSAAVAGSLITDYVLKFSGGALNSIIVLTECVLILIFVSLFFAVLKLISVAESQKIYEVSISRDSDSFPKENAFDNCTRIVLRATKSIYVIGPHFPSHSLKSPRTINHDKYLVDGMNEALEHFLGHPTDAHEGPSEFKYFRVIQLDPSCAQIDPKNGVISEGAIGDRVMAAHIQHALNLRNKSSGKINMQILARSYVPSMPSILVVDGRYVFFSLPTYGSADVLSDPELNYNFVFEIEDKKGVVPQLFIQMITQLQADAVQIQSVEMSGS